MKENPDMNIDEINAYLKSHWQDWTKGQWLVICSMMKLLEKLIDPPTTESPEELK